MKTKSHVGIDWKNHAERHSSFQLLGPDNRWVANVDLSQFSDEEKPRIRRVVTSPSWAESRKNDPSKALQRWALKMHRKSKPHII